MLEDFAKITEEKGICLHSLRFKRGRPDRELKLPNAGSIAGRISELAVSVEGGQTYLVVRFYTPTDGAAVCELEYAAHLAAYRIELLAGGMARPDGAGKRNVGRLPVIEGLIGESELIREVRQDIATATSLDLSVLITGEAEQPALFREPEQIVVAAN